MVVAEPIIIKAAERECADVVPLYYEMKKAAPAIVTPESMYDGMEVAWTCGGIGIYSNNITKILARDDPDIDAVKILTCENNYQIDAAKTLFFLERPAEWDARIRHLTNCPVPAFFQFAKDREADKCMPRGSGVIDRLYHHIRIRRFKWSNESIPPFDYKMLMFSPNRPYGEREEEIVRAFREQSASMQFDHSETFYDSDNHNWWEIKRVMKYMEQFGRRQDICDILIRGLFAEHKTPHKAAFWMCYGDVVYDNLSANLKEQKKEPTASDELVQKDCTICGSSFTARKSDVGTICPACRAFGGSSSVRRCIDCGEELPPIGRFGGGFSTRCADCQKIYRRNYVAMKVRERRKMQKCKQ